MIEKQMKDPTVNSFAPEYSLKWYQRIPAVSFLFQPELLSLILFYSGLVDLDSNTSVEFVKDAKLINAVTSGYLLI